MTETVAIIGASLAGVSAATALRERGFEGRVALISDEPHLPYDRPPLSKDLLQGTRSSSEIQLRDENFYMQNAIELLLGCKVTSILPAKRRLVLADGATLRADKVVLCTGGRPRRLTVPGSELEGVHYLRRLDDASAIQARLVDGGPVVVVGAGFIGAEVAASARGLGLDVTLLEIAPVPLGHVLGDRIGALYAELHRSRGVDVRTGVGVARIEGDTSVQEVVTTDGQTLPARLVVIGIGIEPDTRLAEDAGIATGNGVLVDAYGQTSCEGVFAAGDVANRIDGRTGDRVRHEHWQTAQRHAAATAASVLGEREPFSEIPWFWSDQYDVNLQLAGSPLHADEVVVRGDTDDLSFTAFYLQGGRLTGVLAVDRPRDVRGAIRLIELGARVAASVLSNDSTDLRKLAKRLAPA
jgi:3-phenylpropionate/trans-cinnamate dioxygenase ferredoxin reductase subunit